MIGPLKILRDDTGRVVPHHDRSIWRTIAVVVAILLLGTAGLCGWVLTTI